MYAITKASKMFEKMKKKCVRHEKMGVHQSHCAFVTICMQCYAQKTNKASKKYMTNNEVFILHKSKQCYFSLARLRL